MEYKKINPNLIKPNDYNPNQMTENTFNRLINEIKRIGFINPVIINKNNIIIDGEHRWKASLELNLKEIPVIQTNTTDNKIETVNLNQIKGDLNPIKFAELLKGLKETHSDDEIIELFDMSKLELETYDYLLEAPDFNFDDLDINLEPKLTKCPNCGHEF